MTDHDHAITAIQTLCKFGWTFFNTPDGQIGAGKIPEAEAPEPRPVPIGGKAIPG